MKAFNITTIHEADPTIVAKAQEELVERMDPGFWDLKWMKLLKNLYSTSIEVARLGQFIESITYGQVGSRYYDPSGEVIYLQTINITTTGIDIYKKLARIKAGSHNDPPRSRVQQGDLLLVNSGVKPIGKAVAVMNAPGPMNISQDIDKIRLTGLEPAYVAVFMLCKYGNSQIWRICSGVGAPKINFGEVKSILIPVLSVDIQSNIHEQYGKMSQYHDAAMNAKAQMLGAQEHGNATATEKYQAEYEHNLKIAEAMLNDLIRQVEEIIEGKRTEIEPVDRILKEKNGAA